MKILLDIRDNKATFFMEVLKNFSFVKAIPLSEKKAIILKDLKEAKEEVELAKRNEIKLQSAKDFMNKLLLVFRFKNFNQLFGRFAKVF